MATSSRIYWCNLNGKPDDHFLWNGETFPDCSWIDTDYIFDHWNTKPDNTGISYWPEEPMSSEGQRTPDGEWNFYAIWVPKTAISKYYVTDTQLRMLADAIRAEGGTSGTLIYPADFVSAINNLAHIKTNTLSANWPTEFNNIYWTTETALQSIAEAIRSKNSSSEALIFLKDFVNNLVNVHESDYLYPITFSSGMGHEVEFSKTENFTSSTNELTSIPGDILYMRPYWDREYMGSNRPDIFASQFNSVVFEDYYRNLINIDVTWYNKNTEDVYCSLIVPNLDNIATLSPSGKIIITPRWRT